MKKSTIKIKILTKKKLDSLKVHPRQSYDEVINFIIKKYKDKFIDSLIKNNLKKK